MPFLIDRRLNPKDKSLGNRQRFLRRARAQIKEAVDRSINGREVADAGNGGKISISSRGIREPRLRHASTGGNRERVLPGNKEFVPGDQIAKPQGGAGDGRDKQASDHGEGQDDFVFSLSRDEFLDIFFDDLELPDLIKTSLKETKAVKMHRAGHTSSGMPANLSVERTMRNSIGRRIALRRPAQEQIDELRRELERLEEEGGQDARALQRLAELRVEIQQLERRQRTVAFIDPLDLRYKRFEPKPEPRTKAVMFCLMDVSGSMGQHEKDLAKRFFILLHLFLERRYEKVDIVFIRHTHQAEEVDEQTFFYSAETGGTVVSTALEEMLKVVQDRYSPADWNIYAAQASDGDNFTDDTARCLEILQTDLLPVCQYYAYVEILDESEFQLFSNSNNGKDLWRGYQTLLDSWPNFSMKHIAKRGDIYPVFRELFSRQDSEAAWGGRR